MQENNKQLKTLGKKLKELRKAQNMKAIELAEAANITKNQLSEYENGRRCMAIDKFKKIIELISIFTEEKEELYNLFNEARKETYKNFSNAAKTREKKKKTLDFNKFICYN